jgi:DTW domain-containing protein
MTIDRSTTPLISRRPLCPRCERPCRTCLCGWVRPVANALPVLLLQHPLEVRQAKGSARLLALSLARCRLAVGEVFEPAALAAWLAELGEAPVLLYPDTPALPAMPPVAGATLAGVLNDVLSDALTSAGAPPGPCVPTGLVVVDATWRKSLRLLHLNPALLALPRLALHDPPPSRYAGLRVAPRPAQRATLEATCLALAALTPADAALYGPLLVAFEGLVAAVAARQGGAPWPAGFNPCAERRRAGR